MTRSDTTTTTLMATATPRHERHDVTTRHRRTADPSTRQIDNGSETCPACQAELTGEQVRDGWSSDPNDYTTECRAVVDLQAAAFAAAGVSAGSGWGAGAGDGAGAGAGTVALVLFSCSLFFFLLFCGFLPPRLFRDWLRSGVDVV